MSAPDHTSSKTSFLNLIRLRLASMNGDDEGNENAFSGMKRKLKNITTKSNKPVDKTMIRIIKAGPALDDIVLGTQGPATGMPMHINKGETIFFRGTDIPIINIVKDLSLPAPIPLKPALKYVYGDSYAPPNLNSFEPKETPLVPISPLALQYEIDCLLEMGRQHCKEDILFKLQSVLCECSSAELGNMVELFASQKHILPLELAQHIMFKQSTDKHWQKDIKVEYSLSLPEHIQPRKRPLKKAEVLEGIRAGTGPGPSSLANELLVNEDTQITAPRTSRTSSNTSATTTDTDETLVDEGAAYYVVNQTSEPEAMENEEDSKSIEADLGSQYNTEDIYEAGVDGSLILLVNGFTYDPLAHTIVRNSVKLERSESIYSEDSEMPTRSIRKRICRFVGFSKK